jgi:hypothetical protein
VNTITAGKLLIGDDSIPDVYYFGQVPGNNIFGLSANTQGVLLEGSPAGTCGAYRNTTAYPDNFSFPANTTTLSANLSVPLADAFIPFPEPIHYTATSGGDPLNPYIHASIMSSGLSLPTGGGSVPGVPVYPSIAGTACVRPGIQALNPIIVVKQDANLLSASGAWFGLPIPYAPVSGNPPTNANTGITPASAVPPNQRNGFNTFGFDHSPYSNVRDAFCVQPPESPNYHAPLQMSFFVAGCPPSTPPAAWAAPTTVALDPSIVTFNAYSGFAGFGAGLPIQCHKFDISYPSGLPGSGITFPAASQGASARTTVVNANPALYPDVVYPINGATTGAAMLRLANNPNVDANGILAPPPYTNTGGIWVQQVWWIQTRGVAAIANPGVYNITHLFTKAGGGGVSPVNACRLEVSPRANDDPNGAFSVSVYLPRVLSTANRPAVTAQNAQWVTSQIPGNQIYPDIQFSTARDFGYFVVFLCASSAASGVAAGGTEAAPTPTACRCSDNTVPPSGQAGAVVAPFGSNFNSQLLGQFSQYPPGFTDNQTAQLSPGPPPTVRPYGWQSTPVAPVGPPPPWYVSPPLEQGAYTLVGNI